EAALQRLPRRHQLHGLGRAAESASVRQGADRRGREGPRHVLRSGRLPHEPERPRQGDARGRDEAPRQVSAVDDPRVGLCRQFRAADARAAAGCDQPHLPRPDLGGVGAMAQLGNLEAGNRHDLHVGISPDAPDEGDVHDEEGAFGYVHSYETGSRYDGPSLRVVLFMSGCLLRCSYCHNPDTWHLKDGTYVSAQHVIDRLGAFAPALRMVNGGLTISGGEPMVQLAFTRRVLAAAQEMGLHTAIETSGFLGDRADERYLSCLDLVLLDIKS